MNKNCLSYWFPKLLAAGVPVPRTNILTTDIHLFDLLDGKTPDGFEDFIKALSASVLDIGLPCFLRTGQGSGKHQWKDTCCVTDIDLLSRHVAELVNWSACVDFIGLPFNVWCSREFLPVAPIAVLPDYGNMPLVKEIRCFVRGGNVVCHHPYWPADAICQGYHPHAMPADLDAIVAASSDLDWPAAKPLAETVAAAFKDDGAWSVDLLETTRGWYVTDMAEAERSFHWPGCVSR